MYLIIPVLVLLCKHTEAVIYTLNESEYARMPALYKLDNYDACLQHEQGVYCLVDAQLHTEHQSELMDLLKDYSANTIKHFNRTQIHRGVCLTSSCRHYGNGTRDQAVEACLNDSLWNGYGLQVRGVEIQYCESRDSGEEVDLADMLVAALYVVIISLNVIGSFYDIKRKDKSHGDPYVLSFSVFQNWKRLTAPSGDGPDPRLNLLKSFNGFRTMTMICVFFSHTVLIMAFSYVENPIYIEKSYEDPLKQILFNGSLVTFTFFTMSSFLLAYNIEIHSETHNVGWGQLPKGIIHRWLRLTPSYALVLATICTWMRHLGAGPLWRGVVTVESRACRAYWWTHLLYINNYVYRDVHCFPQSWYLAADTQLFCVGLVVCILSRSARSRRAVLGVMFTLSLLIPALQTYLQDLDAVVLQTPENYRNLYENNYTFRWLYVSGHANLATYTIGLTGGFLAYRWQRDGVDFSAYKKYRFLFWLVFPAGVGVILSGGWFYSDGARAPVFWRVLYATLYKPLFQFLVITLIVGIVFKFEKVYRGVVEWRGWSWSGRVSYAGFLLHSVFQRGLVGNQRQPTTLSDYYVLMILSGTIFLTFMAAVMLWLLVEAPCNRLIKVLMKPQKKPITGAETKVFSSKL